MKRSFQLVLVVFAYAAAAQLGCSIVVGADFDVHHRPSDAAPGGAKFDDVRSPDPADVGSTELDARNTDGATDPTDATSRGDSPGTIDASSGTDGGDPPEVGRADANEDRSHPPDDANLDSSDGGSDDVVEGGDAYDAPPEPPPEGGIGPTVVTGGFVSTGVPAQISSGIELRGHVVSNGTIGGLTAAGISIEGRFR